LKYFSLKIIFLCILLPPLLYLGTLRFVEDYLHTRYVYELENSFLGDSQMLFDGAIRLKDAVNDNVHNFLSSQQLIGHGLRINVTVVTTEGTILYPAVFSQESASSMVSDPMAIAAENYRLLQKSPILTLDTTIEHLRLFPNLILAVYAILAGLVLYLHYRLASRKYLQEEAQKQEEIQRLLQKQASTSSILGNLDREKKTLTGELNRLKKTLTDEKDKASRDEDDLIDEIESLESELNKNLELQAKQQSEIYKLNYQMEQFEKGRVKSEKQKKKTTKDVSKRFETLYKNITVSNHAVDGFIALNEDIKIKSEEVIHQLNENPELVIIKRKVFIGKRDKKSIMEVIFGYKGRLYFRKTSTGTIEVLAIGDKKSQGRELDFLTKFKN
jgi:hypothetical protein